MLLLLVDGDDGVHAAVTGGLMIQQCQSRRLAAAKNTGVVVEGCRRSIFWFGTNTHSHAGQMKMNQSI